MTKIVLESQLDKNVSVYIDDVVVRNKKREDHIQDLRETFANLCRHGLKLNPEKCVFGVRRGKLLGCMITERGDRDKPREDRSYQVDETSNHEEGGTKANRPLGFAPQVHF